MASHAYLNGHAKPYETPSNTPDLAESIFWRMQAPTGRLLLCGLYHTEAGLEVRAGYAGDDPIWTEEVPSEEFGLALAASWKAVMLGKGGFVDLDTPH